jgi:hypothetical protein
VIYTVVNNLSVRKKYIAKKVYYSNRVVSVEDRNLLIYKIQDNIVKRVLHTLQNLKT